VGNDKNMFLAVVDRRTEVSALQRAIRIFHIVSPDTRSTESSLGAYERRNPARGGSRRHTKRELLGRGAV
jgi:hypothetical protein